MNNEIQTFCSKYLLKVKNDSEIKEKPMDQIGDWTMDFRERISFRVHYYTYIPGGSIIGRPDMPTITLDEEDLKYLHNKYSKKLNDELEKNIEELKKKYNI